MTNISIDLEHGTIRAAGRDEPIGRITPPRGAAVIVHGHIEGAVDYPRPTPDDRPVAPEDRLRALLAWALPYLPEPLPSMEGGEYADRYREAAALSAARPPSP